MFRLPVAVLVHGVCPFLDGQDLLVVSACSRAHLLFVHRHGFSPWQRLHQYLKHHRLDFLPGLLRQCCGIIEEEPDDFNGVLKGHFMRNDKYREHKISLVVTSYGGLQFLSESLTQVGFHPTLHPRQDMWKVHGMRRFSGGPTVDISVSMIMTNSPHLNTFDGRILTIHDAFPTARIRDASIIEYEKSKSYELIVLVFLMVVILLF